MGFYGDKYPDPRHDPLYMDQVAEAKHAELQRRGSRPISRTKKYLVWGLGVVFLAWLAWLGYNIATDTTDEDPTTPTTQDAGL